MRKRGFGPIKMCCETVFGIQSSSTRKPTRTNLARQRLLTHIIMFKLAALLALVACAVAAPAPGLLASAPVAYSAHPASLVHAAPVATYAAHAAPIAAPIAYAAHAAPIAYAAHAAPIAYAAHTAHVAYAAPAVSYIH
nr:PREDICTED: pupal cuticle protein C1B-like [Linepithema humile]